MLEWVPPKYLNTYKVLNLITAKMLRHTLVGTVGGLLSEGRGGNMSGWEERLYGRLGEPSSGKLFQQTRDMEPILVQYWADVVDGGPTLNQHWFSVSCVWELSAVQSQKAVSDYFTSKQILAFGFVEQ